MTVASYNYLGPAYSIFEGARAAEYSASNRLSIRLDVSIQLPANTDFDLERLAYTGRGSGTPRANIALVDWSITDGLVTMTPANAQLVTALLATDAAGQVVRWQVSAVSATGPLSANGLVNDNLYCVRGLTSPGKDLLITYSLRDIRTGPQSFSGLVTTLAAGSTPSGWTFTPAA